MNLNDWKQFKRSGGYRRKVTNRYKDLMKPGGSGIIPTGLENKSNASSVNAGEVVEGSAIKNITLSPPLRK